MGSTYEILGDRGTAIPQYDGLEYDYEVPDDMVVDSPGGTSSTHHHWTKGFYGYGGVSSDVYGHMPPAHLYGDEGSLYGTGPTASQTVPHGWGANYYPSGPSRTPPFIGNQAPPAPPKEPFDGGGDGRIRSHAFGDGGDNIELLEPAREMYTPTANSAAPAADTNGGGKMWKTLLVYLLAFIAFSFWAMTAFQCTSRFHAGAKIPLLNMFFYSLGLTVLVVLVAWLSGWRH